MSDLSTLRQLTDRIYYLPADHRTDRPVLAAILGTRYVLMVDGGASPAHAQHFLDELERVTHRRPDWVAVTHWHWDHTFGLSHLALPAFGHMNLARNLARLQGLSWSDGALAERVARGEEIAFCAENIGKEYGEQRAIDVALPTITFDDMLTLDLGDTSCRLHHIPTDHTDDAVAVYVVDDEVLFLGDAMGENLYASPPYYSAACTAQLVAAIERLPIRWFVGGHGEPVKGDAFWAENRILAVVAELIQRGITERGYLVAAVELRLAGQVPEDFLEVIDLFLNSV
jgi:glyoxylase-like metal-dependent hydrolase (beta-lactamase superfamily II)